MYPTNVAKEGTTAVSFPLETFEIDQVNNGVNELVAVQNEQETG
jgi:hypothetical protein